MLLELGKAISLCASILSLYAASFSAFFVPGTRWEERLFLSFSRIAIAACVCFASGLLFAWRPRTEANHVHSLLRTLPVQLFFCGVAAMTLLFAVSWYLAVYYIPLTYKKLPW
jgi:drug/metabolite transporter (DMT)-like permease